MEKLILIIPFIPILAAILISIISERNKEAIPRISMFFSAIVVVLGLVGTYSVIGQDNVIYGFNSTLAFGKLASILIPYVAILSMVIKKYSAKYMWDEKGYKRFFILLNFIFSAIYLLILSNHLAILVIAWQIMSLVLYFLVSFNIESKTAVRFGNWTILLHKIADFLFILAVVLLYKTFGTFYLSELSNTWLVEKETIGNGNLVISIIGFLFLIAAFIKSAIIPFHIWLPYTSEGPTPVSALMHAGVVNVGGIVLNKLAYLFLLTPTVLNIAFAFGLFTAIFASMIMLTTPDIKRSLGYSTVGQMGYMIMEIGLGAFSLAVYHLIVHGIFKASLFLESGSLIHYARHDPNIPKRLSYEIFWEEKVHHIKQTKNIFLLIALFTVLPVLIFAGIKLFISKEFFYFNAAIIILAFGWLTGSQLFFSFFKVSITDSPKIIIGLIVSFTLIVLSYEFIGKTLEEFMYGKHSHLFYHAASLNLSVLFAIGLLILILVVGWIYVYKQHFTEFEVTSEEKPNKIKWTFYKLLAKEAYFPELFIKISKKIF